MLYSAFNSVAYLYSGHILISSSLAFDSGKPCLLLDMHKVNAMQRNISHVLKTPNDPHARYQQCADFDGLDSILSQPKWPLDSNMQEGFEEENDPQLPRITGDIVIIKDK